MTIDDAANYFVDFETVFEHLLDIVMQPGFAEQAREQRARSQASS